MAKGDSSKGVKAGGNNKPGCETEPSPFLDIEVFRTELGEILARRKGQNGDDEKKWKQLAQEREKAQKPSANFGLVGLALSGGGIRSATFNLGVLQALHKHKIFQNIDYLSTVSGGGYIGSCLSSLYATGWTNPFPFEHTTGKREGRAVQHLREYSNYLAPKTFLDRLRLPALVPRGIIINFLIVMPYVLLATVLTALILPPEVKSFSSPFLNGISSFLKDWFEGVYTFLASWLPWDRFLITQLFAALFLLGCVTYPVGQSLSDVFGQSTWSRRNVATYMLGIGLLLIGIAAVIEAQSLAISYFNEHAQDILPKFLEFLNLLLGNDQNNDLNSVTLMGLIIGIVGALFSGKLAGKAFESPAKPTLRSRTSQVTAKAAFYTVALIGPLVFWVIYLNLSRWVVFEPAVPSAIVRRIGDLGHLIAGPGLLYADYVVFGYILLGFIIFIPTRLFVDVNRTSLHNFYRDRLSKAYLFGPAPRSREKPMPHNDKQRLSTLDTKHAPYHLINAALNIQYSKTNNLRGRNAEFFIFSKKYVGSELTGYCKTKDLEERFDPHVNLGTAMAISGAAASPNMGKGTKKPMVFILAMLNIRLGYWLINPRRVVARRSSAIVDKSVRFVSRVGPLYLLKEMFSRLNERGRFVNLSDGGHVENLGLYELLRRRCKYIIVCDAEADPLMKFTSLAHVMRLARIDMGIQIDFDADLKQIRKDESGQSERHCAFGRIDYGNDEIGELLYIKSSVTGDEVEYIREYRVQNPDFPHETTGDQFFDEAQFEAYRALGYHIVNRLIQGEDASPKGRRTVSEWFDGLV